LVVGTAYVTDGSGQLYEHMEYFPFGETWADQRSNTQRVPYLFTGKEYDEETGLYYFGARYYDPRTSVWESADPALGKYLPPAGKSDPSRLSGPGGVFNSVDLGLFTYAANNPLRVIDADGKANYYIGGAMDCAKSTCNSVIARHDVQRRMRAMAGGVPSSKYHANFTYWNAERHHARPPGPPGKVHGTGRLLHSAAFKVIAAMHKQHPKEPINIFGHSWGGESALELHNELTEAGIPVNTLNTYDGVSRRRDAFDTNSSATWNNFFIPDKLRSKGILGGQGLFGGFNGDFVARLGGPWGARKGANNWAVTDWPGKNSGSAGHMEIFFETQMHKVDE